METPSPPLAHDKDPLADPRIAQAEDILKELTRSAHGFIDKLTESHLWSATEYEESYFYMLAHNGILVVDAPNAGESYIRALIDVDYHRPVLRYERLFFTMLDAYRPANRTGFSNHPTMRLHSRLLLRNTPDARIVVTHRNPLITLPFVCRLLESWCIAFTRDGCFDKHRFARLVSALSIPYFSVPFSYRRANPDKASHIFDCIYDELFADPIAMVKRFYDFFNLEVTAPFESGMRTYIENNRQGKYGQRTYSLEE